MDHLARSFLVMFEAALRFQTRQHHANRGGARRVRQPATNLLGGRAIAKREDRVHDFPLPAGQAIVSVFDHLYATGVA
jgi:hypothetical protein